MGRRYRRRHQTVDLKSKDHVTVDQVLDRRGGFNKRVVFRWFLLFTVVLALINHFYASKGDKPEFAEPGKKKISHYHGEVVKLGAEAVELKALQELPSRLANLRGLSPGSEEAQKQQLNLVQSDKLPLEVENSFGIKFRLIPAGTYVMGSPVDEPGRKKFVGKGIDIEEQHTVEISEPFYISKYEITQKQWRDVMGENPPNENFRLTGDDLPVVEVNWYDAVKFCKKLAETEEVPVYRYRLPSESEWEYACRAGTETPFHFAKGAYAKHFTIYNLNSNGCTHEVGTKLPNAWGVYNMHGNVWEWCLDYYRDHFTGKLRDGEQRNIKGGSWYHDLKFCRSANRSRLWPKSVGNMLGFRIIRKIKAELEEKAAANVKVEDKNE